MENELLVFVYARRGKGPFEPTSFRVDPIDLKHALHKEAIKMVRANDGTQPYSEGWRDHFFENAYTQYELERLPKMGLN